MTQNTDGTPLVQLAIALNDQGWRTRFLGDKLKVTNPEATQLSETVVVTDDGINFAWDWGLEIGRTDDVSFSANRVRHVLRSVETQS